MMDPRLLGRFGEAEAAEYLRRKGWDIVGMNYRTRLGEVDLIARNRRFVVFVEVKLRRDDRFAQAREFVTRPKQRRIAAAAQEWLQRNPTGLQPRFDVVEIYAPAGADASRLPFHHVENAFERT